MSTVAISQIRFANSSHIKGNQGFSGLRLTRRGRVLARLAVILSTLVLLASGYSAFSGASAEDASVKSTSHLEVIVVAPGETLWSIAALVGGDHDEAVSRIMELNALNSPHLKVGDRLIIPTRG